MSPDRALMQVLAIVAAHVAEVHRAGYVHRNVKPANVLWLPREARWALVDYGCAAHIGEAAPLAFTLAFAPPEAAAALAEGHCALECAAAHDSWSLGVLALELLTAFAAPAQASDTVRPRLSSI